jgi:hypothetical protein
MALFFIFGFPYLCMLVATGGLWRISVQGKIYLPLRLDWLLIALCAVTLAAGFAHALVPALLDSEDVRNRLENILEWNVALAFTLFFVVLAWLWRRTAFTARLESGGRSAP